MPVAGLNDGMAPVLSYNYGAKHRTRIIDGVRFAPKVALGIMTAGTLLFQLFPARLLAVFGTPVEMIPTGIFALRIISTTFPCAGTSFILSGTFQSLGAPNLVLLLGLTRQIVIVLPGCLFLALTNPALVWLSFPAAELFSCVLAGILYGKVRRERLDPLTP